MEITSMEELVEACEKEQKTIGEIMLDDGSKEVW